LLRGLKFSVTKKSICSDGKMSMAERVRCMREGRARKQQEKERKRAAMEKERKRAAMLDKLRRGRFSRERSLTGFYSTPQHFKTENLYFGSSMCRPIGTSSSA